MLTGNLLSDDTGQGADSSSVPGGRLVLTEVNGQLFEPGKPISLPSGATLTVAADGAFTYDPSTSSQLSSTASGGSGSDSFSYSVAPGFSEIYVFGDILSDIGNMFDTTSDLGFGFPPPPYYQGRASDGPLWSEYLAPRLDSTMRDLGEASPNSFAVYGAQTDDGNFNEGNPLFPFPQGDFDGLTDQLATYAGLAGGAADPDAVYLVWAGANDFINPPTDPVAAITESVGNITTAVGTLRALGAENIVVANMPDLGLTPRALALGAGDQFTQFTVGFNSALAGTIGQFFPDVELFDTFAVLNQVVADPGSFGFSDVTTSCFDFLTGTLCDSSGDHLFWDDVHPTTAGHQVLGDLLFEQLLGIGPLSAMDSADVTIEISDVMTPPTVAIDGPQLGVPGQPLQFSLTASDASPSDQSGDFSYAIDWDGNGSVDEMVVGSASVVVSHTYESLGAYTVYVAVTDQDGDASEAAAWTVNVEPTAIIDGNLLVGGTSGNDTIVFYQQSNGDVHVLLNHVSFGSFQLAADGRVVAYGLGGSDFITAGNVNRSAEFWGGDGADYLIGSRQDDTLHGGAGRDWIFGLWIIRPFSSSSSCRNVNADCELYPGRQCRNNNRCKALPWPRESGECYTI